MSDDVLRKQLLSDLEALRQSLDQMARSEPSAPLLDEVVEKRPESPLNPDNPFLSSNSLSELIRIRDEAEARSAASAHADAPDPILSEAMEAAFERWADRALADYLALFERDLRRRLRHEFARLLAEHQNTHPNGSD